MERVALWIFFYFTQHLSIPVNTPGTHPSLFPFLALWRSFHPLLRPRRCHIITWRCKQPKNYLFHTDFSCTHILIARAHTHTNTHTGTYINFLLSRDYAYKPFAIFLSTYAPPCPFFLLAVSLSFCLFLSVHLFLYLFLDLMDGSQNSQRWERFWCCQSLFSTVKKAS